MPNIKLAIISSKLIILNGGNNTLSKIKSNAAPAAINAFLPYFFPNASLSIPLLFIFLPIINSAIFS